MSKINICFLLIVFICFSCKRKRHADITGRVVDINSGEGIGGCEISLLSNFKNPKPGKYQPCNCETYSTTTSSDGSFKFDYVTFKKPLMKGSFGIQKLYVPINLPEISSDNIKYLGRTKLNYEINALCFCRIKLKFTSSISGSSNITHTIRYTHPNPIVQSYYKSTYYYKPDYSSYWYYEPAYPNGNFIINSNAYDASNNLLKSQIDTIKNLPCASTIDYTITVQ